MLFGSGSAEKAVRLLDEAGYRRLLDLPALPAGNACQLRYDVLVPVLPGPTQWYMRSFGVHFELVHRSWRRLGSRWYSLGWGMAGEGEVAELLLIQAWGVTAAEVGDGPAGIRELARDYLANRDHNGCVRVAAIMG